MHWTVLYLRQRLALYRVFAPAAAIVVIALIVGVTANLLVPVVAPLRWRAERAANLGEYEAAERVYWRMLSDGAVAVPVLLYFLRIH